jgi:hypothetical protein
MEIKLNKKTKMCHVQFEKNMHKKLNIKTDIKNLSEVYICFKTHHDKIKKHNIIKNQYHFHIHDFWFELKETYPDNNDIVFEVDLS